MSGADPQGFSVEDRGGLALVRLDGPKVPPELAEPLYRLIGEGGRRRIVLDLGAVRYLSSNGIAILATLKKRLDAAGGALVACRVDPDVQEILKLSGVDRLIPIYPGEEEALAAC